MANKVRTNFGRFQKYATINITKHLQEVAEDTGVNVRLVVADELEKKYKENVAASYTPSSAKGQEVLEYNKDPYNTHRKKLTYRHTGIFLDSIYTKIDDNSVKVMLQDNGYPGFASVEQVYKWLTEGTKGGDKPYPYLSESGVKWSKNFPMPAHLFEQHTMLHMKGFLDGLEGRIKNGEFSSFRYTGKKKKRTTYKGQEVR